MILHYYTYDDIAQRHFAPLRHFLMLSSPLMLQSVSLFSVLMPQDADALLFASLRHFRCCAMRRYAAVDADAPLILPDAATLIY